MFYIAKDTLLTAELLHKMIYRFNIEVKPTLEKYKNYYDGKQGILNKQYADATKPCSKSVVNYTKSIADAYTGYLSTPGHISYTSDEDIEEVMNILRYNDYESEDSDFLLNALIYGVAAELMYLDSNSQVRFRLINPTTCFGVYDDSLTGDLLYFVRFYRENAWEDTDIYTVKVYTDSEIYTYRMAGVNGVLSPIGEGEPHHFSQCPANIFTLPDEKSIFDCVLGLQDAANEVLNSEIDDFSAFCDSYLILQGVDADGEDIAAMRKNRAASIPADATMYYLTKQTNDTQVENILKRIHESIYRIAQCPDFSSESFIGGVSSGVAIRYRLCGMENRAGKIEAEMKKALQRRIEIICGIASLKLGEAVYRDVQITFKRNIPEDINAVISLVNSLKGTVSDATLLSQIPFITDVNAELEAVREQAAANLEMYSFSSSFGSDDEE